MTDRLQTISFKLPVRSLRRIPARNRSEFLRQAVEEKLQRRKKSAWEPKTATGRRLLALRRKYVASGGELLDADGIAAEIRARRGGLA